VRIRGWAPATPCWAELATVDTDAAAAFYGELFDWKRDGSRFLLRDASVAGLTGVTAERPGGWMMHLSTDDLDAGLDRVIAAGGLLRTPPTAVGSDGRGATVTDPCGALFGLWQRGLFGGAQVAGEPGAMCWTELCTPDPYAAADFYARSFDWLLRGGPASGSDHGEWLTAAHYSVAGLAPGSPARWRTIFQVEDCERTAHVCALLGGSVRAEPTDGCAELTDPFGATFTVIAPAGHGTPGPG
jgi:predicted enzyme related to lactoylglutathione lyase